MASFGVVVGVVLVAEGFGKPEPEGCACLGMTFSRVVEMPNIRMHKKAAKPVQLQPAHIPGG